MTGCACQGSIFVIQGVFLQAKFGHLMFKINQGGRYQIEIVTLMFQMTASASFCPLKSAVKSIFCPSLPGHILMASFAAGGLNPLERGVTLAAIIVKVGMGEETINRRVSVVDS